MLRRYGYFGGVVCAGLIGALSIDDDASAQSPQAVEGYRFLVPTVEARPGEALRVTVQGEHEESAQGFVFAARYPADDLSIQRVHIEDTILEAIDSDFFEANVQPDEGILVVAALVDADPPFEGQLIPNIGFALDLFYIEATLSDDAVGPLSIDLENGLSNPPVENSYSVKNHTEAVTELGSGIINVLSDTQLPVFLRGDVNMDETIDLSDPILFLNFAFRGDAEPPCAVAADVNDDETLDISDAIYTLDFLFTSGAPPPPPISFMGPDPTPGGLSCRIYQ